MACPANRTFLEFNLEALSPPAEQSLFPILGAGRTRHIESQTALGLTLSYRTAASLTAQERLQAISDLKHWPHGTFPWIRRSIITALENPGQAVRYGLICKEDFWLWIRFCLSENGQVLAFARITAHVALEVLEVRADYQGQGIGSAMIVSLLQEGVDRGRPWMILQNMRSGTKRILRDLGRPVIWQGSDFLLEGEDESEHSLLLHLEEVKQLIQNQNYALNVTGAKQERRLRFFLLPSTTGHNSVPGTVTRFDDEVKIGD